MFKHSIRNSRSGDRDSPVVKGRESRWWIIVGILVCLACIQAGSAFNAKAHFGITSQAANDEGISFDSVQNEYLVINQEMVDVISLANDDDNVDKYFVPDMLPTSEEFKALFSNSAHFQNYNNSTEIDQEWGRLINQTHKQIVAAEASGDHRKFLTVLGMSLHTLEDFYGHTTWADFQDAGYFEGKGYEGDVTWFDVKPKDKNATSGIDEFFLDNPLNSLDHKSDHKDWPSRPHYQWIRLVKSWVSQDFWNAAMDPTIDTSTWGHISETPYLPHYDSVDFEGIDNFLMHFLWYAGTWTSDYSKSIYVMEDPNHLFGQLYWYATDFGFIENGFHINDDDDYRAFFDKVESYGYYALYKQGLFTPSDGLHIDILDKIPPVRWFSIQTLRADQTDCDWAWDIDPGSQAEFYNKIDIEGHRFYEAPPEDGDDDVRADEGEFVEEWRVLYPLPMDQMTVDVNYALWEEDFGAARSDDDHCDINRAYHERNWFDHELSIASPQSGIPFETNGLRDCTWYWGSYGDGDEARVRVVYDFFPRGQGAAIGLAIETSEAMIHPGDTVTYTYTVTNAGTRPLSKVAIVTDNAGIVPVYKGGDANHNGQLDTTETWTYTATATITTEESIFTHTATATATDTLDGVTSVTTPAQAIIVVFHPAIKVEKTASSYSIDRGDSVTYTYTVTNAGNIRLKNIQVVDNKVTPVYKSGDTNGDGYLNPEEIVYRPGTCEEGDTACLIGDTDGDGQLSDGEILAMEKLKDEGMTVPGEIWIYTAPSSPTHTVTNTVTASGTDPLEMTVTSTDSVTVIVTVIVKVDIKPGSCPNGFGLKDKGVVPVAILGGLSDYTIDEIKTSSIKLNGVPTSKIQSQDVATPYMGTGTCGCHILTQDSIQDVLFQFDAPKVAGTLSNSQKKTNVPITLTGTLKDGITLVKGSDCLKIS